MPLGRYDLPAVDPHLRAILLALAAAGVSGAILLLLIAAIVRRRARKVAVPIPWIASSVVVGVVAASSAYLSLVFLGMTVNGGSYARTVEEVDGVLRRIERRNMWGRSGLCLAWDERGELDLAESGFYSDGKKDAELAFEADAVGYLHEGRKCGPWLFLGVDGTPDPARSGWYEEDGPAPWPGLPKGSIRPLDKAHLEDLLLAWESR